LFAVSNAALIKWVRVYLQKYEIKKQKGFKYLGQPNLLPLEAPMDFCFCLISVRRRPVSAEVRVKYLQFVLRLFGSTYALISESGYKKFISFPIYCNALGNAYGNCNDRYD